MGRTLILVVLMMTVVLGLTTQQILNNNVNGAAETYARLEATEAQNLARSGMEIALVKLSNDTTWRGINSKSLGDGTMDVDVVRYYGNFLPPTTNKKPDWDEWCNYAGNLSSSDGDRGYLVRSTGTYGNQVVQGFSVLQHTESEIEPPDCFDYALFVNYNWNSNGNCHVVAEDGSMNADVHLNQSGNFNGVKQNNPLVEGFLTYSGSQPNWNPSSREPSDFLAPNSNPENLDVMRSVSAIEFPEFNPDDYKDIATQVHETNLTLSGNQSYGTADNPEIVYVGGDLHISGTVDGYAVFVVSTNAHITGNVTLVSGDNSKSHLAIYTGGDLVLTGNAEVYGQCYVKGNLIANGNPDIYGQVLVDGDFNENGHVMIHYRPANVELVEDIFACEGNDFGVVETISYLE